MEEKAEDFTEITWLTRMALMLGLGASSHAMRSAKQAARAVDFEEFMRSRLPEPVRNGNILPLVLHPDSLLSKKSLDVIQFGRDLSDMVASMGATMYMCGGVGLSAIQVGIPLRVLVLDTRSPFLSVEDKKSTPSEFKVYVNPEMTVEGDETDIGPEGCLSLPGILEPVRRSLSLTVTANDVSGNTFSEKLSGWPAKVFQHEFDHLNGIVMLKHMGNLQRRLADKKMKKLRSSIEIDEKNARRRASRRGGR